MSRTTQVECGARIKQQSADDGGKEKVSPSIAQPNASSLKPAAPRRPRYRLYIDESGDHAFNKLEEIPHRFLALLGVWFKQEDDLVFSSAMDEFKAGIFPARSGKPPVILHRSDIINRKGPFGVLREETKRKQFDDGLLGLVGNAPFKMICVILDKKKHQDSYLHPYHPYHYCLAAMLERYCGWLLYKNAVGDVVAETRGKEEDVQLKQAYLRIYESGTFILGRDKYQRTLTTKEIKIRPKDANSAGLQLADALAHPVKQALLIEKGLVPDPGNVFGKQVYEIAKEKFNRNEWRGNVEGYGIKCL
jgi:hypothetical protein